TAWRTVVRGLAPYPGTLDALVVDRQGDVVTVGTYPGIQRYPWNFTVVKLSGANGSELWRYAVPGCTDYYSSEVNSLAVADAGDIVTAGRLCIEGAPSLPFAVVKLSGANGSVQWLRGLDAPETFNRVAALVVDAHGDVVAGSSSNDQFTVSKLSGADGGTI